MMQQNVCLGAEIVEVDGAKKLTHKKTSKAVHLKRQRRFPKNVSKIISAGSTKSASSTKRAVSGQIHHGRCLVLAVDDPVTKLCGGSAWFSGIEERGVSFL